MIATTVATYPTFQTLEVRCSSGGEESIELDGPDAWELYQRLEQFIISKGAAFPEAILAFEFDEGFAGEEPTPKHAWTAHLLSPCCGRDVEGVYVERQTVNVEAQDILDRGVLGLDSSDGEGNTLIYTCCRCEKGVSIPEGIEAEWF